ncbi:flagellar hook-basal body protein [Paenalkalicoccus suaedae]|uniref:Flagellar hook-basal body protein n=1 Tax=Paenalkalicoccus suaedae TaxID=2592382 RepID=A0A859FIM6_9BACI|nr:flagellar hook-basal body protein [Paenalkalicoccus suaedae]QKS72740.1 flagellar hook-basal body protein [Paenalkalicoccus suaedae]
MNQSMINSSVTMGQIQHKLDTIGNNLANANTTGFKRREASFSDLLFQQVNNQRVGPYEAGRESPEGIRRGSGAVISQTALRFEQGDMQMTERDLDVALTAPGYFFEVSPTENGERRFTRSGSFYLSPVPGVEGQNNLVNQQGEFVLGADGNPVVLPANPFQLRINESGVISTVDIDGNEEEVATLQLVNITRPQLLTSLGENYYTFPNLDDLNLAMEDVMEEGVDAQVVQQGALEMANVDTARQMADMLSAQRFYQFNSSAIQMTDQMMGMITNLR